ncbi:MAG: hypothetical protein KAT79_06405 [candidate division Zixibacteria bacterium]|nr:hypothetical protein [candidate division Zixibacteria bacterium]
MKFRFGRALLSGLILLVLFSGSVSAQEIGTIQATANVLQALVVRGLNNLEFGVVTPGINKTVDKGDVGPAGEWDITGPPTVEVLLDFDLPDSLIHEDSIYGMQVVFSTTDVSYDDGTGGGQTAPVGIINPHALELADLGIGGVMNLWIGGTVMPRLTQTGGYYTADVVLTVTLTGN